MRSKYAYGILSFSATDDGPARDAVALHAGRLFDLQGTLAVLRRAVLRARQRHEEAFLRADLALELPRKLNQRGQKTA